MEIIKTDKWEHEGLTKHSTCKDSKTQAFCIHDDENKQMIFGVGIEKSKELYEVELPVLFCPYCGSSYER